MNEQTKTELIERRIDREITGGLTTGAEFGGLRVQNMLEVMEMSKLMSLSQQAVPMHLRANPGMCLAVCLTALEWKMSPFAVANKTYVTNDRLNYESQLVHAVIEARAPLKERLKVRYEGEGAERVCIVSGTFKGEKEAREHRSPPLKDCLPPRNEYGKVKGSPLWDKKPDVQMFYDTSRDWIRIYAPDVLLGIYTPDEVEQYDVGADARDITPDDPGASLHERLKAAGKGEDGFRDGVVETGLNGHAPVATTSNTTESSAPADVGAAAGTASVAPSNSSQPDAPPAPAETKPAPAQVSASGAGATQSPAPPHDAPQAGEERQATEPGTSALDGSAGLPDLPDDWAKQYAAALSRAQKIGSLSKYAAEFWKPFGNYDAIKPTPHYDTAEAIYAAFRDHFGAAGEEARNVILHELGAA